MADEPCNHQNHQFVLTVSAILPMLFADEQLHAFLIDFIAKLTLFFPHALLAHSPAPFCYRLRIGKNAEPQKE